MGAAIGDLENTQTLGSNLSDLFNYSRKQEIYRGLYGTDNDFKIVDKGHYKGEPYDQVYAILDYKRKGLKVDILTYAEVCDYNDIIITPPNMLTQFVKKEVFLLAAILHLNGSSRASFEKWKLEDIDIFKYLGGNPRAEKSGIAPCLVLNGKETHRKFNNGVRVNLKTVIRGLTHEQYMEWEIEYRKTRWKETIKALQRRDYLLGRG